MAVTVSDKLKTIQKISRLSQEKLAQKLNVSFATLNSWFNAKSQPRKKALTQIESLYLDLTGQRIIPEEDLTAKKHQLKERSKRHPNVFKEIMEYPDILDQFTLSLTYHTNRIEGSTLTEPETAAILFQNVIGELFKGLDKGVIGNIFLQLVEFAFDIDPFLGG